MDKLDRVMKSYLAERIYFIAIFKLSMYNILQLLKAYVSDSQSRN